MALREYERHMGQTPWTVRANALLAVGAILVAWALTPYPLTPTIAAFFTIYLALTTAFVWFRSALMRFLMTGFHIVTSILAVIAILRVPPELSGDAWIPVRAALVMLVAIGVIVLQWLPATQRWLDRD